jgi:hypothetical protein
MQLGDSPEQATIPQYLRLMVPEPDLEAIAVELDFVNPVVASRRPLPQHREEGSMNFGRGFGSAALSFRSKSLVGVLMP